MNESYWSRYLPLLQSHFTIEEGESGNIFGVSVYIHFDIMYAIQCHKFPDADKRVKFILTCSNSDGCSGF